MHLVYDRALQTAQNLSSQVLPQKCWEVELQKSHFKVYLDSMLTGRRGHPEPLSSSCSAPNSLEKSMTHYALQFFCTICGSVDIVRSES